MYSFDENNTEMVFAIPLSMSKLRTDAMLYCGSNGILVDLRVKTPSFYFNAHLVSSTPQRNETVFFNTQLWSIRRVWDIQYGCAIIDQTWKGKNVTYLQKSVIDNHKYLLNEPNSYDMFDKEWQQLSNKLNRFLPIVSDIEVTDIGVNNCTV